MDTVEENTDNTTNNDKTDDASASNISTSDAPKKKRNWKQIVKISYVVAALVFGFGLALLKQMSSTIDDWLDKIQTNILEFLAEESIFYIFLIIILVTAAKSIGIKDVLGIRAIIVVILFWRVTSESEGATFLLSMLFMGILSSISKLIEYRAIGSELQYVIGKPIEFMFKYIRLFLIKIFSLNPSSIIWFDPKWTLEISYKSRGDIDMSVVNNFQYRHGDGISSDGDTDPDDNVKTRKWWINQIIYYILAILWTSCIEWVQPITELFQFAHNWQLTFSNIFVIIMAEFCDFDKMLETWIFIEGVKKTDIISAKMDSVIAKVYFWSAGYTIILFPTLYWAYKYHSKFNIINDYDPDNMFELDEQSSVIKSENDINIHKTQNDHDITDNNLEIETDMHINNSNRQVSTKL